MTEGSAVSSPAKLRVETPKLLSRLPALSQGPGPEPPPAGAHPPQGGCLPCPGTVSRQACALIPVPRQVGQTGTAIRPASTAEGRSDSQDSPTDEAEDPRNHAYTRDFYLASLMRPEGKGVAWLSVPLADQPRMNNTRVINEVV